MNRTLPLSALAAFLLIVSARAANINQEGRILPPLPAVAAPTLFNTPSADAVVSAMQVFPVTNAWNERVTMLPPNTNSSAIMTTISNDVSDQRLRPFFEMNFVLIPPNQPLVPITFDQYGDESDPSPYPIPSNLPIEGWPVEDGSETLSQVQTTDDGNDRHALIVDPAGGGLWETWRTILENDGWHAANGAKFDMTSNNLRPAGWTSGDAAGLTLFAGLARYDECERGMVEHALRLCVPHTRAEYIYPATHYASNPYTTSSSVPAMGERLRLQAGFTIPGNWTTESKAVARALQKYSCIVADNSSTFFSISVIPDDRFPAGAFDNLLSLSVSNFEVVQTTGATGGPRSPGAPTANAGTDQNIAFGQSAQLNGTVTGTSPTITWYQYSGPGTVTFSDATQAATTATFSALGNYTLMLSADDNVHAVAYSAMNVTVVQPSQPYQLTVVNGSGSGSYLPGSTVTISANASYGGQLFWQWTGATVQDPSAAQTQLTMPASAATVTANYDYPPVITSGPTAIPAQPIIGEAADFSVTAVDQDGDPLSYTWDFGDGATASGASATHAFTALGNYTVMVSVSDGKVGLATQTFPVKVVYPPNLVLAIISFSGSTTLGQPLRGGCTLTGKLSGYVLPGNPPGIQVEFYVGSQDAGFTLNAKGRETEYHGSIAFALHAKPSKPQFTAKLFKVGFNYDLRGGGVDTTKNNVNAPGTLPITLIVNNQPYYADAPILYTGKANKPGKFKGQ